MFLEDVVLPAESIYDGTWGSGEPPEEFVHFELMRELHWSHAELMATPQYVITYCWALINTRRQAEHDANERASREARRAH